MLPHLPAEFKCGIYNAARGPSVTGRKAICATIVLILLAASVLVAQQTLLTVAEQVQYAKALLPTIKKVAVITTMKETENELKQLVVAGKTYSVTFDIYDVPTVAQTREAFQLASNSVPTSSGFSTTTLQTRASGGA